MLASGCSNYTPQARDLKPGSMNDSCSNNNAPIPTTNSSVAAIVPARSIQTTSRRNPGVRLSLESLSGPPAVRQIALNATRAIRPVIDHGLRTLVRRGEENLVLPHDGLRNSAPRYPRLPPNIFFRTPTFRKTLLGRYAAAVPSPGWPVRMTNWSDSCA